MITNGIQHDIDCEAQTVHDYGNDICVEFPTFSSYSTA